MHQIFNLRKESGCDFPELGLDLHVNNITRSCFFQLRQLRSIRRSLTMEATKTLDHYLVSSHVDYCSSIFRSNQRCPEKIAIRSQRGGQKDHEHKEIRTHQRIIFKISNFYLNLNLIQFAPFETRPTAVAQLISIRRSCNPISEIEARAHLRSAARRHLTTPCTRTRRFGPRSFRVSGPTVWNSLPDNIKCRSHIRCAALRFFPCWVQLVATSCSYKLQLRCFALRRAALLRAALRCAFFMLHAGATSCNYLQLRCAALLRAVLLQAFTSGAALRCAASY